MSISPLTTRFRLHPQDVPPGAAHIGVDVGGTKVDVILVLDGTVIDRITGPTGRGSDEVFDTVTGLIGALLSRNSLTPLDVAGYGVGIPGAIDSEGIVRNAVNLAIEEMPLRALLQQRVGRPVSVENDVNATALGLHRLFDLPSASSLAFINLGTGLAAGLVLDGRLWRGATGGAGEIGHIPLWSGVLDCVCGQTGCAELFASGSGIRRRHGIGELTEVALDELAHATAHTIISLTLTLDVSVLILGGGVVTHTAGLLDRVRDVIEVASTASPLLRSYGIVQRIVEPPADVPIGALGAAALVGQSASSRNVGARQAESAPYA